MQTFILRFIIFWVIVLLLIFLLTRYSRSWKKTARTVIARYQAARVKYPSYSDRELFLTVLDERYPQDNPATKYLYSHKEEVKEKLAEELASGKGPLQEYNLPTLIYCCLAVERNKALFRAKDGIAGLLSEIENYVKEQELQ